MYGHSYFPSRRAAASGGRYLGVLTGRAEGPGMPRIGMVIREVYHRAGGDALPAYLEDHYGIRVTGTVTALAAAVRAHSGRPA